MNELKNENENENKATTTCKSNTNTSRSGSQYQKCNRNTNNSNYKNTKSTNKGLNTVSNKFVNSKMSKYQSSTPLAVGNKFKFLSEENEIAEKNDMNKDIRVEKENGVDDEKVAELLFDDIMKNTATVERWKEILKPCVIVEIWIDKILEKKKENRVLLGDYFRLLINGKILKKEDILSGFQLLVETAEDLIADIPKLWLFLAVFL